MRAVKPARLPHESSPSGKKARNGVTSRQNGSAHGSPRRTPGVLVRSWRTIKSIYYASAPSWQVLKSGALLFFGFFCWATANLLLSYQPEWQWTYVLMAYGFVLTWYGPVTHLLLVPHLIPRLRRRRRGSLLHWLGKQLTPINLTIFTAAVLLLGLFPPDVMTVDFGATTVKAPTTDVNATLTCSRDRPKAVIHCRLEGAEGVPSVVVESGGRRLLEDVSPAAGFTIREEELTEVVGQRQFEVELRDEQGATVRRYTRWLSMIR